MHTWLWCSRGRPAVFPGPCQQRPVAVPRLCPNGQQGPGPPRNLGLVRGGVASPRRKPASSAAAAPLPRRRQRSSTDPHHKVYSQLANAATGEMSPWPPPPQSPRPPTAVPVSAASPRPPATSSAVAVFAPAPLLPRSPPSAVSLAQSSPVAIQAPSPRPEGPRQHLPRSPAPPSPLGLVCGGGLRLRQPAGRRSPFPPRPRLRRPQRGRSIGAPLLLSLPTAIWQQMSFGVAFSPIPIPVGSKAWS